MGVLTQKIFFCVKSVYGYKKIFVHLIFPLGFCAYNIPQKKQMKNDNDNKTIYILALRLSVPGFTNSGTNAVFTKTIPPTPEKNCHLPNFSKKKSRCKKSYKDIFPPEEHPS
jgi:hypothetical protein